jgi:hypothetical protein
VVKTCDGSGMSCPNGRCLISTVRGIMAVGSPVAFNIALCLFLVFRLITRFMCCCCLFSAIMGPLG